MIDSIELTLLQYRDRSTNTRHPCPKCHRQETLSVKHGTNVAVVANCFACGWKHPSKKDTPCTDRVIPHEQNEAAAAYRRDRAELEQRETQSDAAEEATKLWERLKPAPADHPYLKSKKISPHIARHQRTKGALVIPVFDVESDELISIQKIWRGEKRFQKSGRTKGGYCAIGDLDSDKPLVIAEGFATAASIHEATDYPTVVAFTCSNVLPVAQGLRARYRKREIIVAADNDDDRADNPGVEHATAAARAVGARLAIPPAPPGEKTDFNDVALARGKSAVWRLIKTAKADSADTKPSDTNTTRKNRTYRLRPLSEVEPQGLEWLVDGLFLRGMLNVLFAEKGMGKSTVLSSLAALLSRGKPMPCTSVTKDPEPRSTILLCAEESSSRIVRPRLDYMRANTDHIFDIVFKVEDDDAEQPIATLMVEELERLGLLVEERGDVVLTIVDALNSFVGNIDTGNDARVRTFLEPLSRFADRYNIAVVVVIHPKKSTDVAWADRVMGSVAMRNVPRSVVTIVHDPDEPTRLLLTRLLCNEAPPGHPAIPFYIRGADNGGPQRRVVFEKEMVEVDPETFEAGAINKPSHTKTDRAKELLREWLAEGPMPVSEIKELMKSHGISWSTVRDVKDTAGVESKKSGREWEWRLVVQNTKHRQGGREGDNRKSAK